MSVRLGQVVDALGGELHGAGRDTEIARIAPLDSAGPDALSFLNNPRYQSQLATSQVPAIAYISCNPGSFARDVRILQEGGYRLEKLMPIDQFLWSAHVELVALLTK